MATLHTVNQNLDTHDVLEHCLQVAHSGDGLLLLEEGIYAASVGSFARWHTRARTLNLYVLREDVLLRGMEERINPKYFRFVDYEGFTRLCLEYSKVVSWF
ncbi:tRNA 2-thiouridine synthesizing protein B [Allopseudospirillum japonicum]|uniref:tRNA 2-thiouridine synthesizing protein B n=1 Tax=Allopseudospirillum japonicum TaxID=64971 RepID=A0A1H6Q1G1_9GAMM|nr:sulfurtransferase complex subunit TusB [Allopseudospirillum japonicum]SEI37683.1 tRNA 2-thiouridine synthesizing protein B [Allopseudospirillum japonicum]